MKLTQVAVLLLCGFALSSSAKAATQSVLRGLEYKQIELTVCDLDGTPIPNARFYGYSRDLQLIWPRTDTSPDRDTRLQYYEQWKDEYAGVTDKEGRASCRIPNSSWAFAACGVTKGGSVVVAWTDYAPLPDSGKVSLRPAKILRLICSESRKAPDNVFLRHERLLVRPSHMPVWLAIDSSLEGEVPFEIPLSGTGVNGDRYHLSIDVSCLMH